MYITGKNVLNLCVHAASKMAEMGVHVYLFLFIIKNILQPTET